VLAGIGVLASLPGLRPRQAAILGLVAGTLFAGGDISVKLVVQGGLWLVAVAALIPFYVFGTIRLQSAFQHGDALAAAGMATLATNAIPIAAGFVLFGETLPGGFRGPLQIGGFVMVVAGAVALSRRPADTTRASGRRRPSHATSPGSG
jgi:hypothetical protein